MRWAPALLIALVGLAGCVEDTPSGPDAPDEISRQDVALAERVARPDVPVKVPFEASQCRAAVIALLAPFEAMDPHLPPGFTPADAMLLMVPDVPGVNQGAFILTAADCDVTDLEPEGTSWLSLAIFVEEPNVPGDRQLARFNFYELHRYNQADAFGNISKAMQWPHEVFGRADLPPATLAEASPDFSGISLRPTVMSGSATKAPAGAILTFDAAGTSHYLSKDEQVRWWTTLPGGYGLMQVVPQFYGSGGTATCTIDPDTEIARILEERAVCDAGNTVAGLFPEMAWQGFFERIIR